MVLHSSRCNFTDVQHLRGGMIVYRFAQWYPNLVSHVFSVCTPYIPPSDQYLSTADVVNAGLKQFGYQLQLAGPEVEANVQSRRAISQFLQGMYGGRVLSGEIMFNPETGIDFGVMEKVGAPLLLNQEEVEYYTNEYSRTGLHGPCKLCRFCVIHVHVYFYPLDPNEMQ